MPKFLLDSKRKVRIFLLIIAYALLQGLPPTAMAEPIVPLVPRITNALSWILSQEVEYVPGRTAFAASSRCCAPDYFRLYTDDNARLAMALVTALQYMIKETRNHPFFWDDKIKVAINFVMNSRTPAKDFYHYWQLPGGGEQAGWRESGAFYFWDAAIVEGLAIVAAKMRWDRRLGVPAADFAYYDGVKNVVEDFLDTWQPNTQQPDGAWLLRYEGSAPDTQVAENGMILAALTALSYYERNLGNTQSSSKYARWAQLTAKWLLTRQERRPDRNWLTGGGYGGFYNNKDDVVQYSAANGRAVFSLALYGLNIESIVDQPSPNRAAIADAMKAWLDGFVARTHDERWGPIDRVTSAGAHLYPKYTYVAASVGTAILGGFDFLLDNKYYDMATNFYRWITGRNEKLRDFQNAWNRAYQARSGFYLGIEDTQPSYPVNEDSNTEANLEALQFMISLDDSSLAWSLDQQASSPSKCFIATATYGSELSPEVQFLRTFRDDSVMRTFSGSHFMVAFNAVYYSFSPSIAELIAKHPDIRAAMKFSLYPLMDILRLGAQAFYFLPTNPELAAVLSGLIVSLLLGATYFAIPVAAILALSTKGRLIARKLEYLMCVGVFAGLALVALAESLPSLSILIILGTSTTVVATLASSALLTSRAILVMVGHVHPWRLSE